MDGIEQAVRERLFALQDKEYRAFHSRLMPDTDPETIIGVRTPQLRRFAREFGKTKEAAEFLKLLPHTYYEENNLHGFLIEEIRDYDTCVAFLDEFLPYIDNWATCDMVFPKVLKKHLTELLPVIRGWISSDRTYTVRYGIGLLMKLYLGEAFTPEYLQMVASVKSEEYYVNMMIAWYFATALALQYEAALPYIEERRLAPWTHNKTIQKAVESYRIPQERKGYLRTLRIKQPSE